MAEKIAFNSRRFPLGLYNYVLSSSSDGLYLGEVSDRLSMCCLHGAEQGDGWIMILWNGEMVNTDLITYYSGIIISGMV